MRPQNATVRPQPWTNSSNEPILTRTRRSARGLGRDRLRRARAAERALEAVQARQHVLAHLVDLLVQVRDLELGLEVDLVLDVAADAIARGLPVRAEQEQRRQDDRL